jgi:hypothetical protein
MSELAYFVNCACSIALIGFNIYIENKFFKDDRKRSKIHITIDTSNPFHTITFSMLIALIITSPLIWFLAIAYGIIILWGSYKRNKDKKK